MRTTDLTARRHTSHDRKSGPAIGRYVRISVCGGAVFAVLLLSDWAACIGSIAGKTCLTDDSWHVISQARAGPKKPLTDQVPEQAKQQVGKALGQLRQVQEQQSEQQQQAFERDNDLEGNGEGENGGLKRRYRPDDEGPPKTMVELFRRIFAPRSKEDDQKKESRGKEERGVGKKGDAEKAEQAGSEPSARRPRGYSAANTGVTSSFRKGEVIAINLSNKGRGRAENLGFRVVSSSYVSSLGANVTRLRIPPGFDTRDARQLLKHEFPADSFELNKVYRLDGEAPETTLASQTDDETAERSLPRGRRFSREAGTPEDACDADHCFARSVMRWKNELASCSKGLRVGILDTGVDLAHPAFRGQNIRTGSFVPAQRLEASNDHGTAITSVLAGSRNSGTPGLIPNAEFFAANIFYLDQDGIPATDSVALLEALDWMDRFDVQLINMSFTGPEDALVHQALKRMSKKRVALVAASGNQGPAAPPLYPAAYPEVVAVTAVNKKLRNYRRASRGAHVDVAAPGVEIWTAYPNGQEGYQSGTSFAAPHVTALLATIYKNRKSVGTPDQMISYLPIQDLGSPGRDPVYGRGLVQAPSDCWGSDQPPDVVAGRPTQLRHGEAGSSWALAPPAELSSWQPWRPLDAAITGSVFSLNKEN